MLQHDVLTSVVVDYYKYLLFQVFHRTAPLVVLLTTLISFGILARNNEVTAAKALGISLYRMASPILVAALAIAGVSAFVGSTVLPYSNARVAELRDQIKGRETVRSYKRANQHWLYSSKDGGYIYHYQYFDARRSALQRLHVFRFEPDTHALSGHLFASEARFYDGAWWVRGGWAKDLEGVRATIADLPGPQRVNLPEDPEFFSTEIKQPEQMSFGELRDYIAELEESGQDVPALEVELYSKAALPTVCVVMALVALPFAFYLGRRGALYGIGVALILAMAFYALIALFTTLGETGALPALVAVWTPNLLFGIFSLFLFLGVRT